MPEVAQRVIHYVHDFARAGEVDTRPIFEGFPSLGRRVGAAPTWFAWDDFAVIWDRLELALGGELGFARAARQTMPNAFPEVRAFAAAFLSPMSLFRFLLTRHMRTSFRNVENLELERSGDERIRWRESIPEGHRPCPSFHRATRTFVRLLPLHLDLPEAQVEMTNPDARTAEYVAHFPLHPTISSRGRRAATSAASHVAAQIDEAFALIGARLSAPVARSGPGSDVAAAWPDRLALSHRQRDVFALLVAGRANKDIAAALACSERNVEFHVGRILRAARVSSRSELLVKVLGGAP
ncbi:hypothetical protein BH11MYX4_BH11MYX4_21050 [soil metagenome]